MLKKHVQNTRDTRLNMKIFFFNNTKMLKVKSVEYDVKNTKKYIENVLSTKVKNILYYIYFKLGVVHNHGKKNVGRILK
jgi:hypothetical protein